MKKRSWIPRAFLLYLSVILIMEQRNVMSKKTKESVVNDILPEPADICVLKEKYRDTKRIFVMEEK